MGKYREFTPSVASKNSLRISPLLGLAEKIKQDCLITGRVTLSSGMTSNYYFDCKPIMLDGKCLSLIADAFLDQINKLKIQPVAIGGLTMGADFITAAVIMRSFEKALPITLGSIVRKSEKYYGANNLIENRLGIGTPIVVVDDVLTTGASIEFTIGKFWKAGYKITGVIVLIDREEGATEMLTERYGVPVLSIFKKSDFNLNSKE